MQANFDLNKTCFYGDTKKGEYLIDCLPLVFFDQFFTKPDNNTWLKNELDNGITLPVTIGGINIVIDATKKKKDVIKKYLEQTTGLDKTTKLENANAQTVVVAKGIFQHCITYLDGNKTLSYANYGVCGGDVEWNRLCKKINPEAADNSDIAVVELFGILFQELQENNLFAKAFSPELIDYINKSKGDIIIRTFGTDFVPIIQKLTELGKPVSNEYKHEDLYETAKGIPKNTTTTVNRYKEQYKWLSEHKPVCVFQDDFTRWSESKKQLGKPIFIENNSQVTYFFDDNITDPITDIELVTKNGPEISFQQLWPTLNNGDDKIKDNIKKYGFVTPLTEYPVYLIKPLLSSIFDAESFILQMKQSNFVSGGSKSKRSRKVRKSKRGKKRRKSRKGKKVRKSRK